MVKCLRARVCSMMALIVFPVAMTQDVSAADGVQTPLQKSATAFHAGGFNPQARGDVLVGADALARDSLLPLLPSLRGDAAFYDDAPGCTLYPANAFPFGHRFARFCR